METKVSVAPSADLAVGTHPLKYEVRCIEHPYVFAFLLHLDVTPQEIYMRLYHLVRMVLNFVVNLGPICAISLFRQICTTMKMQAGRSSEMLVPSYKVSGARNSAVG